MIGMKVILATPFYHQQRGNTVTVNRISKGLQRRGIDTTVISSTEDEQLESLLSADLVHGFNVYRFHNFLQRNALTIHPYIVTLTGTDLNVDLFDVKRRKQVIKTLIDARAIHLFEEKGKRTIAAEVPEVKEKLFVLPQGIDDFPTVKAPVAKEANTFLFLLPAGIRKIKNVPFAIKMLSSLKKRYSNIRLWIVGPILEEEEGEFVQKLANEHKSWITYLGQLPHSAMGSLYAQSDVVLNTSDSEGQPSAILEAMSFGLPTLVANNDGNKSIVNHRKTGFIYDTEEQFYEYAETLIKDPLVRKKLGNLSKEYVGQVHSVEKESATLQSVYETVLNKRGE